MEAQLNPYQSPQSLARVKSARPVPAQHWLERRVSTGALAIIVFLIWLPLIPLALFTLVVLAAAYVEYPG
jgi:hypothetical protein